MNKVRALVAAWLVLDFFGDARRHGGPSSSLTSAIFTQSFLALVFAALMYPETPPVPFAAANLCLSSLLVAIGVLGDQDRALRARADAVLLGTAPLGRLQATLARGGHAAFYTTLVTIGMALPPAILLAIQQRDARLGAGYLALAVACSGLAGGALGVLLRALDRWLGHARATLLAGTVKALLLGGGLVLFALGLQNLQKDAAALPIGRLGAELLPPYHAARWLLAPVEEAWRLLPLLGGGLALLLLGMALGETDADRPRRPGRPGLLRHLLRRLAGGGPTLAIAEFVAVSMWRSPGFRGRVLPLLGLPAGMAFLSLQGDGGGDRFAFTCLLLQLPAIYLPFLIAFLPRADQAGAEWVFAHAPAVDLAAVRDGTWRALLTHVLLPVHALALLLLWLGGQPPLDVAAAVGFAFGIAGLAARPLLRSLGCVPFTQSRDADAATDLGGLFTAGLLLAGLGAAFGGALGTGGRLAAAAAALGGLAALLRRRPVALGAAAAVADERPTNAPAAAQPAAEPADAAPEPQPGPASLGRELRAILVLYLGLSVLPLLFGTLFAG